MFCVFVYYRSMDFITIQSGGGILQLLQTVPTIELIRFGYISHLMMHIIQPLQVDIPRSVSLFCTNLQKGSHFL